MSHQNLEWKHYNSVYVNARGFLCRIPLVFYVTEGLYNSLLVVAVWFLPVIDEYLPQIENHFSKSWTHLSYHAIVHVTKAGYKKRWRLPLSTGTHIDIDYHAPSDML